MTYSKLAIYLAAYTKDSIGYFKNLPLDELLKVSEEIREIYSKRGDE